MDKDSFYATLLAQYKEEIEEILVESEHVYRSTIDYELLDSKVSQLIKCAHVDGLKEKDIWDMIQSQIPSYVNYVNFKSSKKAA